MLIIRSGVESLETVDSLRLIGEVVAKRSVKDHHADSTSYFSLQDFKAEPSCS